MAQESQDFIQGELLCLPEPVGGLNEIIHSCVHKVATEHYEVHATENCTHVARPLGNGMI